MANFSYTVAYYLQKYLFNLTTVQKKLPKIAKR